jgi:hypothetical protein
MGTLGVPERMKTFSTALAEFWIKFLLAIGATDAAARFEKRFRDNARRYQ